MADCVRRARNRPLDAERAAGAADERRLAGAELAGEVDDVARLEPRRQLRRDALRLLGRGGGDPHRTYARTGLAEPRAPRRRAARARPRPAPAAARAPVPSAAEAVRSPTGAPRASSACRAPPPGGRAGTGG